MGHGQTHGRHFLCWQEGRNERLEEMEGRKRSWQEGRKGREEEMEEAAKMEGRRRGWQEGRNGREEEMEEEAEINCAAWCSFFWCIFLPLCEVSTCDWWAKNTPFLSRLN